MPKLSTFLKKLVQILNDTALTEIITWREDGNSFQIHKVGQFAETVLPHYFKHNNMASFVRQLNMYGFNRPKDSDQHAYFHPNFKRGNVNAIRYIRRKKKIRQSRQSRHSQSSYDKYSNDLSSEQQKSQSPEKLGKQCYKLKKINEELKRQNDVLRKKIEEFKKIESLLIKMEEKQEKIPNEKNNEDKDNGSLNKSTEGPDRSFNTKKQNQGNKIVQTEKRCCVLVLQKPKVKKESNIYD